MNKRSTFLAVLLLLLLTGSGRAPLSAAVWYARAQGTGDGGSVSTPTGSAPVLEASTQPGDVILLLPGDSAFDGGVAR